MTPEMIVAIAGALATLITAAGAQRIAFLQLKKEIHEKADQQTAVLATKMDQVKTTSELQIQASNSFNVKFEKLQEQINIERRKTDAILVKTGITLEE